MNVRFVTLCSLAAIALTSVLARAGETPIDLSSLANEPWTYEGPHDYLIINGDTFPTGAQNFGGIPFLISSSPNNYWGAGAAADFGPGVVSLTIPVGVFGVTSAFTVLNTMWGFAGPTAYLYITFVGDNGARLTVPLVGDINIRDYNQDGNTNSINNTSTVEVWDNGSGQRLDRQEYLLPPEFARQTLTSVTITDTGKEGNGTDGSRAVLAALTVSTCRVFVQETLAVSTAKIVLIGGTYHQKLTLANTGTAPVVGPVYFILEDLPYGVTVENESVRATSCFAPLGSPYIVALPAGSTLAAGTSLVRELQFSDPSGAAITYTPLTAGSVGGLP